MNAFCAEGNHIQCCGKVSKWYAEPGDVVVDKGPLIESDGVGVAVACTCSCHEETKW